MTKLYMPISQAFFGVVAVHRDALQAPAADISRLADLSSRLLSPRVCRAIHCELTAIYVIICRDDGV